MAFIGRERELAVLGSALQSAAEGQPARVVVTGALGMGTSRLMDELVARVRDVPGVVVCRAQCAEPRSGIAYGPLRDAFGAALSQVADSELANVVGSGAHDIVSLLPELGARLERVGVELAPPELDAPGQRGARVREALFGTLGRMGGSGPVVLIVEDLEHSDSGTLEFIGTLIRTSRSLPVALVVGYHPDEIRRGHPARPFVEWLEDASLSVDRIALAPLGAEEIGALAEAALGERPTLAFLAALNEGSRGNPLIAEQLVAAQQQVAGARLSDPLDEIVDARLDELEDAQVKVLRVLAAARRPLTAGQLGNLLLVDGHLPRTAVALAEASGLTRGDGEGIAIAHVLLAEAVEASLLPAERHALHASLAVLFEREPAEAAWHHVRAGKIGEARAAHLEAASLARLVEPGGTTLGHLVAALELSDSTTDEADVEVLAAAAEAADASGSFRRAATLCAQAIDRVAGGRIEKLISVRGAMRAAGPLPPIQRRLGRRPRGLRAGTRRGARSGASQGCRAGCTRAAADARR